MDIVRGLSWFVMTELYFDQDYWGISLFYREMTKWKKRRKRLLHWLHGVDGMALDMLDKAVTWAIGNEPTHKERMTWTSASFASQR